MKTETLFPIRMLGFGFYWAWLFLVGVSPTPVLEGASQLVYPLEAMELLFRLAGIALIIVFSAWLSSVTGRMFLLCMGSVVGPLASVLLIAFGASPLTIALVACADASIFMLWLSFFGHMKLGETALYMTLSYAMGSILFVCITWAGLEAARACAVALPVLSGITFIFSNKLYEHESGESGAILSEMRPNGHREAPIFPYITRMTAALGLYAILFGMVTSTAVCNGFSGAVAGPYIEAPCCIGLGLAIALIFNSKKKARGIYYFYRFVPLAFSIGLAVLLFAEHNAFIVADIFIMTAYLAFEILILNDYCNAIKMNDLPPLRTFGIARFAITAGMLSGWLIGMATTTLPPFVSPIAFVAGIGAVVTVVASTLVFTEKEVFSLSGIAEERGFEEKLAQNNNPSQTPDECIRQFGKSWQLSKREIDVLDPLLKGRTTQYISQNLFIATGTVKTHTYNIYKKMGIHTKMELLDMFDAFRQERP